MTITHTTPADRQRADTDYHESYLIGALLKAPAKLHDADPVEVEDLASHEYRIWLETIRYLATVRGGLSSEDLPAVIEAVSNRLKLSVADAAVNAQALIDQVYSTANLLDFALKVKRAALDRQIETASNARDWRKVRDLYNEQEGLRDRYAPQILTSRFTRLRDMRDRPPAPDWLIRDYLERDKVASLFGDVNTGKSLIALDWGLCIATGKEWNGQRTKRGAVFYLAGEGRAGLERRKEAWFLHHGIQDRTAPFWLSDGAFALLDPRQRAALINDMANRLQEAGEQELLLVGVDTVTRNFGPGDPNSTKDMAAFISACDDVRCRFHCTVLLVHHCGHANKERSMGAVPLLGGLDHEYRVEAVGKKAVRMTSTKQKDQDDPPPLAWSIKRQDLPWADEDGKPINSVVLIPNDVALTQGKPAAKLTGKHRQALEILEDLYRQRRANLEASGHNPDQARVTLKDWQEATQTICEDKSNRGRIRRELQTSGHVRVEDDFVYPGQLNL